VSTYDIMISREPESYFYRCFSNSSAGDLSSDSVSEVNDFQFRFNNHIQINTSTLTALMFVRILIISTPQRAIDNSYDDLDDVG
jgi:hypothetical protein